MTWHIQHGTGYLICFDIPFGHARHYLGITDRLPQRLREHEKSKGAKLTGLARKAGISWTLTRTWDDCDRNRERQLKNNPGTRHCPRCKKENVMSKDPGWRAVMDRARAEFANAVAVANADRANAASKGAGTRQWNKAVQAAQQELRTTREEAEQSWKQRKAGQPPRRNNDRA
jgi:predicted GIY-YIG superfamily endonuclease